MAAPSVTYTFANSTTADAGQVNTNFTDIINGISDGTKDLSISALTCAGSCTLNGSVTLGNASGDDITITGSIAAHIVPKTDATYSLGSTSVGWAAAYFGGNSNRVGIKASASTSATYDITLPVDAGVKGQKQVNSGSAVMVWAPGQYDTNTLASTGYGILDNDGYKTILVTTGASARSITLPTAADNTDRIISIKKIDSGAGKVLLISSAAGETIDGIAGDTGIDLPSQYDSVTVLCDGSDWHVIDEHIIISAAASGFAGSTAIANNTAVRYIKFNASQHDTHSSFTHNATGDTRYTNGSYYTIKRPGIYSVKVQVAIGSAAWSIDTYAQIVVYLESTAVSTGRLRMETNTTKNDQLTATANIRCAAAERINFSMFQNSGLGQNMVTDTTGYVSIHRLP